MNVSRRSILKAGLATSIAARTLPMRGALLAPESASHSFRHRCYLGWITDLASSPDAFAAWPSMRLNQPLLDDYRETFRLMRKLGFNAVSLWGLYVAHDWPVDIRSSVSAERGVLVAELIEAAHEQGIRVYSGLGVYSWGFDEIIRAHPELSGGNAHALCASEPAAWDWMRRVTDFVLTRFPIDGVSLQSADQGRCPCERCRRYGDTEYHVRLNLKTVGYIRSRWPGKTVAVSGWGIDFRDPASVPFIADMSRKLDYLIDVHDTSSRQDPGQRRRLIAALHCPFGTIGGPQVEPPQHWARNRWFLPTAKRQGEHLTALYTDGGRACEYFFHILRNPGDEVSFHVAGKLLSRPEVSWSRHLAETIAELYQTKPGTTNALSELFVQAEDAYLRYRSEVTSTVSLEPLIGDRPGSPVYLNRGLNAVQRGEYRQELIRLLGSVHKLEPDTPAKDRIGRVASCLETALADLKALG
jgi:hypothetical protein